MHMLQRIGSGLLALALLGGGAAVAQKQDDLAEKGPYSQRAFARKIGPAVRPVVPEVMPAPSVELQVDKQTGETNELVVLLNYANTTNIQKTLPAQADTAATGKPTGLERAVVAAVQSQDRNTTAAAQGAKHARFVLWTERMSDVDRARGAELNAPRELLERYIVLRYPTVGAARAAQLQLSKDKSVFQTAQNNRQGTTSWMPNDPYFSPPSGSNPPQAQYQWGLHAMNFPAAWDKVRGHAQIGIMEPGYPGTYGGGTITINLDVVKNYRSQFVPGTLTSSFPPNIYVNDHTTHVAGIIAADSNNGDYTIPSQPKGGVAGGCINCSLTSFPVFNNTDISPGYPYTATVSQIESYYATALTRAIDTGMQVINFSGDLGQRFSCPDLQHVFCAAISYAREREVLIVQSAGNFKQPENLLASPLNLAIDYPVLPVGGTQINFPFPGSSGSLWSADSVNGSAVVTMDGVVAPAKSIVSTFTAGSSYQGFGGDGSAAHIRCGDSLTTDDSGMRYQNGYGDAVGTCTGTSMSAPHVTAAAGLVRSVNPRLNATDLRQILRQSGNLTNLRTTELGYGLPNASLAVDSAIATNPSKLAPLFSFYSTQRLDSFYTTVPQMANAAMDGTLKPRPIPDTLGGYMSAYGTAISGYWSFPRNVFVFGGNAVSSPKAEVWIFTTHVNPKSASIPLEPLYRMSWKCSDPTPKVPDICNYMPRHIDTVLVNESELGYFMSLGYKTDGLEGYIYPKSLPQPAGTVRLMRMYHPGRDDFAIFPESTLATMLNAGYTETGNYTDWLGYAYPNSTGQTPVIQ